jgi:hypothetical protein
MIQRGGSTRFAAKALERLRVLSHISGKELERNESAKPCILGFVHHAHTPSAKLFHDAVVRDGRPDHDVGDGRGTPGKSIRLLGAALAP